MEGLEAVFFPELCFCIGETGGLDCFANCAENWAIAVAEVEFHNSVTTMQLTRRSWRIEG